HRPFLTQVFRDRHVPLLLDAVQAPLPPVTSFMRCLCDLNTDDVPLTPLSAPSHWAVRTLTGQPCDRRFIEMAAHQKRKSSAGLEKELHDPITRLTGEKLLRRKLRLSCDVSHWFGLQDDVN